ncbi:TRAP transporter small permease subunit [Rhodovibrionaceae bacterium A322]
MSSTANVKLDDSRLSRLDQQLFRFESGLNLAAGIVVLLLMLLAVLQIFGRKLFNIPVPGFIDMVEQAMAVFAFLGIAYCQRLGGHIRMDILVGQLKGRALWSAEMISTFLMLLVSLALTYGSWIHFKRAYDLGDSSIDIAIPLWPAKFMVPLALTLLSLRLLIQLWGYARALRRGEEFPVAVPLIEDAAHQAAHEAEALDDDIDGGTAK